MDGMDSEIMRALMEALGHVNTDGKDEKDAKHPDKMSVTVVDAKPLDHMDGEIPEMGMDEGDDDYLSRLKGMQPENHPELPSDDWSPDDMHDMPPSMMMQMASLKKKRPEDEE